MKENTRNMAVGLTIIVALSLLGVMILIFTGLPGIFKGGYKIEMRFPATASAHEGDPIHLSGMRVGGITHIGFTDGDPRKGVTLTAKVDRGIKLPANVKAYIFARGFTGGAYLELKADGPDRIDPETGEAMEFLPTDEVSVIQGKLKTSMIPEDLRKGMRGIAKVTGNLNKLLNEKNRKNFSASLENIAKASKEAISTLASVRKFSDKAGDNVDELSKKLMTDAEKFSKLLDGIIAAVEKIESGQGSAGKLINDPELYHSLADSSEQLSLLLQEFRKLVKKWDKKGLELKLK